VRAAQAAWATQRVVCGRASRRAGSIAVGPVVDPPEGGLDRDAVVGQRADQCVVGVLVGDHQRRVLHVAGGLAVTLGAHLAAQPGELRVEVGQPGLQRGAGGGVIIVGHAPIPDRAGQRRNKRAAGWGR